MTDIYTNEKPFGLMGEEMRSAMLAHFKAGGKIEYFCGSRWATSSHPLWAGCNTYRAVRPATTPDVIAWDRLPDWAQSTARDEDGAVWAYDSVHSTVAAARWWHSGAKAIQIDDSPGLVQIGTCDWKDSKQTRPEGV